MKRTATESIGSRVASTLVAVFFIGFGAFMLRIELSRQRHAMRAANWVETPCTVLEAKVSGPDNAHYELSVVYEYEFGGRVHRSCNYSATGKTFRFEGVSKRTPLLARYGKGTKTVCRVNPENPDAAVLVPSRFSATALLPGIFCLFGLALLIGVWSGAAKKQDEDRKRKSKRNAAAGITAVLVVGAVFFTIGTSLFLFGYREFRKMQGSGNWPVVTGTVVESGVATSRGSKGRTCYRPYIAYSYVVDGVVHEDDRYSLLQSYSGNAARSSREIAAAHPVGSSIDVHVNPADPAVSVVNPSSGFSSLPALLFPVVFIVAGAVLLITSLRRLAKIRRRPGALVGTTAESLRGSAGAMPTGPLRRKNRREAVGFLVFAFVWCAFLSFALVAGFDNFTHGGRLALEPASVLFCIMCAVGVGMIVKAILGFARDATRPHFVIERVGGALVPGMGMQLSYRLDSGAENVGAVGFGVVGFTIEHRGSGKHRTTVRVPFLEKDVHSAETQFEISRGFFQITIEQDAIPEEIEDPRWELSVRVRPTSGKEYTDRYEI